MQRIENINDLPDQPSVVTTKRVDQTPHYSSKRMRHHISVKELMSLPFAVDTYMHTLKNDNFFNAPPSVSESSPEHQFNQDKHRQYFFAGKELSEVTLPETVPAWSGELTQNKARLTKLFGEEAAQNILAGHSQEPTYLFSRVAATYLAAEDNPLILSPNHQRINFYKSSKNDIYQEIIISEFVIKDPNKSSEEGVIGYLSGPARIVYKLEKQDEKLGYRLQSVESDNKDIINMFCDRPLSPEKLRQRYCQHPDYVKARFKLEETISDPDKKYDASLKKLGVDVLHVAINAINNKSVPEHVIANVLNDTSALIKSPTIDNSKRYQRNAQAISKRPWGKVLAASMLVLASTALITASTAVALVSFGALAPVSILGFTLAASTLVGGIAVGAGALGITTTVSGAALFAKDIKKPRSKLANEMKTLAKQVKSRG